jgi:hypothetical protein
MTAEDVHHFRAIGRTASGSVDYFGGLTEVGRPHNRRGYDGELFHILVAEIIEAVHRASGNAQRLPGTNLDGRAVNRPRKNSLDTIKDFFVGIVLVGRRCQLLSDRDENLKHCDLTCRLDRRGPYVKEGQGVWQTATTLNCLGPKNLTTIFAVCHCRPAPDLFRNTGNVPRTKTDFGDFLV